MLDVKCMHNNLSKGGRVAMDYLNNRQEENGRKYDSNGWYHVTVDEELQLWIMFMHLYKLVSRLMLPVNEVEIDLTSWVYVHTPTIEMGENDNSYVEPSDD